MDSNSLNVNTDVCPDTVLYCDITQRQMQQCNNEKLHACIQHSQSYREAPAKQILSIYGIYLQKNMAPMIIFITIIIIFIIFFSSV